MSNFCKLSAISIGGTYVNNIPTTSHGDVSLYVRGKTYCDDDTDIDGDVAIGGDLSLAQNVLANSMTVTAAQIGYLAGVTSSLQAQIDDKAPYDGSVQYNGSKQFQN